MSKFRLHSIAYQIIWVTKVFNASSVQGQACEESTTPQQTKSSIAKTSSKLFFINRFRSRKHRPNVSNSSPPAEDLSSSSSPPSVHLDKQVKYWSFLNDTWPVASCHLKCWIIKISMIKYLLWMWSFPWMAFPTVRPGHSGWRWLFRSSEPFSRQPHGWPKVLVTGRPKPFRSLWNPTGDLEETWVVLPPLLTSILVYEGAKSLKVHSH